MPEGRQSPDPETQTGRQLKDTPGTGKGVDDGGDNKETSKSQLDDLESNPKGPLADHAAETVSKTVKNTDL